MQFLVSSNERGRQPLPRTHHNGDLVAGILGALTGTMKCTPLGFCTVVSTERINQRKRTGPLPGRKGRENIGHLRTCVRSNPLASMNSEKHVEFNQLCLSWSRSSLSQKMAHEIFVSSSSVHTLDFCTSLSLTQSFSRTLAKLTRSK